MAGGDSISTYDVFISYASEDREPFVRELVEELKKNNYAVWWDDELKLGDVISAEIEKALSQARCWAVVVNRDFLRKEWTRQELSVIQRLFISHPGERRILPVLHRSTIDELKSKSSASFLLDIHHTSSDGGAAAVAKEIMEAVGEPASGALTSAPPIRRPIRPFPGGSPTWWSRNFRERLIGILLAATLFLAIGVVYLNRGSLNQGSPNQSSPKSTCDANTQPGGVGGKERVGLVDPSCPLEPAMQQIVAQIETENNRVLKNDGVLRGSQPYRTVMFFGVLTREQSDNGDGDKPAASLQQLRGVAMAQQEINDSALSQENAGSGSGSSRKVAIRVLLANAGSRFASGPEAARMITDKVKEDDHIVALLGIGQSREKSLEAIKVLEPTQLPIIGTAVTGEEMMSDTPHFFRLSPGNEQQAQVEADFVRYSLNAGKVFILENDENGAKDLHNRDIYSRDLAQRFQNHFTGGGRMVMRCHYREDGEPKADCGSGKINSDKLLDKVCKWKPDVVFYASRASQFPKLFGRKLPNDCRRPLKIVGSSDVPKYTGSLLALPVWNSLELYYGTFGASKLGGCYKKNRGKEWNGARRELVLKPASEWDPENKNIADFQTPKQCDFVYRYRDEYPSKATTGNADTDPAIDADTNDAMLGYDAFQVISYAIDQVGEKNLNGGAVLKELSDGINLDLASGNVVLSSSSQASRTPPKKSIFINRMETSGTLTNMVSCGQFSANPDRGHAQWGNGYDCP